MPEPELLAAMVKLITFADLSSSKEAEVTGGSCDIEFSRCEGGVGSGGPPSGECRGFRRFAGGESKRCGLWLGGSRGTRGLTGVKADPTTPEKGRLSAGDPGPPPRRSPLSRLSSDSFSGLLARLPNC